MRAVQDNMFIFLIKQNYIINSLIPTCCIAVNTK